MNILLVAINAKYIHSSLAVCNLYGYLNDDEKKHVHVKEFTVNQSEAFIVSELFRAMPSVLAFSCYIWNIDIVLSIAETFKKILPHVSIIIGGPEVSYENNVLKNIDIIVRGEGEEPFRRIVQGLLKGEPLHSINLDTSPPPLKDIPFAYQNGFESLTNRIIYYETSRGCANRCGYCLSSITKGVRFLSWPRVKNDLDKFLAAGVKQVKFIDRTFNCAKKHAMAIWQYLIDHDNGVTNFHFEIAGERIDEDAFALLAQARNGLFQFEIGVQSTNPVTLESINRATDTGRLLTNAKRLKQLGSIHLHLDLIVGLPFENYESFAKSFNDVFLCYPHKLQVGFLKLLKGSQLRKDATVHGIKYKQAAPYQVLETNFITFAQIDKLHHVEHMVETFYNGTGFKTAIRYILSHFPTPFNFFETLATYWYDCGNHLVSHKKFTLYTFLYNFAQKFLPGEMRPICELLKFDMLLAENVRAFPAWVDEYYTPDNRQITRNTAIHRFQYDVMAYKRTPQHPLQKGETVVHFDYTSAPVKACLIES